RSFPLLPVRFAVPPFSPDPATYFRLYLKSIRVLKPSSTSNMMSPPLPPSPPSGPPAGTNFSLRNDTIPFPPLPAFICIFARSIIITYSHTQKVPTWSPGLILCQLHRYYTNLFSVLAQSFKFDLT